MNKAVRVASLVFLSLVMMPTASAFCGGEYSTRYPLTQLDDNGNPFIVNDSYGMDFGDGVQYIRCNATANYLCYESSTSYDCFLDDTKLPMIVDQGNASSYGNPYTEDVLIVGFLNGSGYDSSIYANHGSLADNAGITTGKVGYGTSFDGNDDLINYPTDNRQKLLTTGTMMGWFKFDEADPDDRFLAVGENNLLYFFLDTGGDDTISVHNYDGNHDNADSDVVAVPGTWYHVAMTVGGGTMRIYINGTEKKSVATGAPAWAGAGGDYRVTVGGIVVSDKWFNGTADEIIISNRTYPQSEIQAHFNNTHPDGYSTVGVVELSTGVFISSPENTTYYVSPVDLIFSVTGAGNDTMYYSLNGAANVTITGNTTFMPAIGANNIVVWVNDTDNTMYSDGENFSYLPTITSFNITQPANGSYIAPPIINITLEYVSGAACDTIYYSISGGANVSFGCTNDTIDMSANATGYYNITFWVINTEGYTNSSFVEFHFVNPLVNCSDTGAIIAVNFTFYDEDTLAIMNGSAEYAITVTDAAYSYTYTYNLSATNVTSFTICIGESAQAADMTMTYDSTYAAIYDQRTYYFYQAVLNTTTQFIPLYLIPSADSDKLEINVRDTNDQDVENAYVNIQRYYVGEDTYRSIAIGKTDNNGKMLTYIYTDKVFYKFIISLAGVSSSSAGPMVITDTADDPETLVLYTSSEREQFFEIRESIGTNCYVNYTTNYTICTVNDASGRENSRLISEARNRLGFTFDVPVVPAGLQKID